MKSTNTIMNITTDTITATSIMAKVTVITTRNAVAVDAGAIANAGLAVAAAGNAMAARTKTADSLDGSGAKPRSSPSSKPTCRS